MKPCHGAAFSVTTHRLSRFSSAFVERASWFTALRRIAAGCSSHGLLNIHSKRGPEDAATLCAAEKAVVSAHEGLLVSRPEGLVEASFHDRICALSDGRGKYLVLETESRLVVHACLWPMGLHNISYVLHLDMGVHLGHWRQGYGRKLLEALIAWAQANPNALKIELQVKATNTAAISLYRSAGFIEEGVLRKRLRLRNGEFVDDLCMALHLQRD